MEFLISSRTSRPGDDPIFALSAEAKARAARGEKVINATVGALLDDEGQLSVMPAVVQALREVPAELGAAYAPIAGNASFLRGVVEDLLGETPAVSHAVAVATPGGTGALRHAIANFLEPQQTLLTSSYYWGPYRTLADEADRNLATFRMFDERGRIDVLDFERKLHSVLDEQGRALIILNAPAHNPTGYSLDAQDWRAVIDVVSREAARGPIVLVIDVAYMRFAEGGLTSCLEHALALDGKAMLLFAWSASKSFAQYGLRVGALVAVHPDEAERRRVQYALAFSCRGTWSNCNAAGMAAIGRVLTDSTLRARADGERAALKALLDRRVARWNELAGAARLRYPRYDGGFFTTVFCEDGPRVASLLKEEGVFVVPLPSALRIALCSVPERDVPRLVEALRKHLGGQ